MFLRQKVFKLTDDDWYPSYTLGQYHNGWAPGEVKLVEVTLLQFTPTPSDPNPGYRVCVWGNDDLGMDFDVEAADKDLAVQMFHQIIAMERVNKSELEALGFVYA